MSRSPPAFSNPLTSGLRACRGHLIWAAAFSAGVNLLYLAPTLYMLQVYERVTPTRGLGTLGLLTLIFVFAVATLAGLDYVRMRLLVKLSSRLDRLLAEKALLASLRIDGANPANGSAPLRDFDLVRQVITGAGALAVFDAPWTPIYVGACFLLHPLLGLFAMGAMVILGLLTAFNERATRAPTRRATDASTLSYISVDRSVGSSGVIRALGMTRAMVRRHLLERAVSAHLTSEAGFLSAGYLSLTRFSRMTLQSLALGLGAYLAVEGLISAGAIFAASLLISRALAPVEQILAAWRSLTLAQAAYGRLQVLFAKDPLASAPTVLPALQGALTLDRVSVQHKDGARLILNGVSFSLAPGESLGIIGPSGSGKSTLARVITRATAESSGEIRYDGFAASDWDESALASQIGYLPQSPSLLRGSVKENISRFRSEPGQLDAELDAEVVRAAQSCGAHRMIGTLPGGYEAALGFAGEGVSLGQAQRIALARALFGKPRLVVLDEPNAHLDAEGEQDLIQALRRLKADRVSVILIAHRVNILEDVDKLMVLRDGKVELFGPRDAVAQQLISAASVPQSRSQP